MTSTVSFDLLVKIDSLLTAPKVDASSRWRGGALDHQNYFPIRGHFVEVRAFRRPRQSPERQHNDWYVAQYGNG